MTTLGVIILHSSVLALERFCLICILLSQTLLTLLMDGQTDEFRKRFPRASLAYVHPQNNILKWFSSLQAYLQPFPIACQTTQVCCLSLGNFAYNFHKSEISAFFTATDYNYYKWQTATTSGKDGHMDYCKYRPPYIHPQSHKGCSGNSSSSVPLVLLVNTINLILLFFFWT